MERFFTEPKTLRRMRSGPLKEYIDLFAQQLCDLNYTRISGRIRLRCVAQFSRWLDHRRIGLHKISPKDVARYLEHHGNAKQGDVTTLNRLLAWLRQKGIVRETPARIVTTPAKQLEDKFALYLQQERGLAPQTIENYRVFTRRFLVQLFGDGRIALSQLRPEDAVNFVRKQAALQPKRAKMMTTALRAFLAYLRYLGEITADLSAAVPTVANWSMSSIPRALPPKQVKLALSNCNRKTAIGRRDYAILLLLARLGLRAGEIASLTLDDIDWEAGRVRIRGKGDRWSELPLTPDIGAAIAAYLRNGRPYASSRLVFLRGSAPVGGFSNHSAVGSIVKHALARAGIQSPHRGAHQLRHALAVQMLGRGASLTEIGELLRHRSPRTTAIYAKVDLTALRPLALPWPGGAHE